MATRRRKRSTRRRVRARANPVIPGNPTRRRRSTRRRGRRSAVYARRRNPIINPTRRRRRYGRRRARRNPVMGSVTRAVPIILSSPFIAALTPVAAQLVGRVAPQLLATPLGTAGTTVLTGWVLSAAMRMFPFLRRWADDMFVAGLILGGSQVIAPYAAQFLRFGNGMGRRGYGMRGIAAVHGVPPHLLPPPPPQNNGMRGVAATATGWGR